MDKTFRLSRVKAGFTDPRRPTVFFYPPGSYVFFVLFLCLPPPHTVDGSYILARATPVVPVVSLALVSYRRKKIQLQLYSQVVVPRIVAAQRKGMSMQALYASRPRPCRGARQYNERKRCHTPEKGHNGHNKGGETVGWDGCSITTKMKRTVFTSLPLRHCVRRYFLLQTTAYLHAAATYLCADHHLMCSVHLAMARFLNHEGRTSEEAYHHHQRLVVYDSIFGRYNTV